MNKITPTRSFSPNTPSVAEATESEYSSDDDISNILDLYADAPSQLKHCDSFVSFSESILEKDAPQKTPPISLYSSSDSSTNSNIQQHAIFLQQIDSLLENKKELSLSKLCQTSANIFCFSSENYAYQQDKSSNHSIGIHHLVNKNKNATIRMHDLYLNAIKDNFLSKSKNIKKTYTLINATDTVIRDNLVNLIHFEPANTSHRHPYQQLLQPMPLSRNAVGVPTYQRDNLHGLNESISNFMNYLEVELSQSTILKNKIGSVLIQMQTVLQKYEKNKSIKKTDGLITPLCIPPLFGTSTYTVRTYKELEAIYTTLCIILDKNKTDTQYRVQDLHDTLFHTKQAIQLLLTNKLSTKDFSDLLQKI